MPTILLHERGALAKTGEAVEARNNGALAR
jgi:hypothetical protein